MFFFAAIAVLIFTALRDTSLFPDMNNYEMYFFKREFAISYMSTDSVNIGYKWLNDLFQWTDSFQLFICFVTFFILFSYFKVIDNYSPYPLFSLFIFILIDYPLSCFLLRQYLAMATVMLSIPTIIKRNLKQYLVLMIIAFSFHVTAFVFLPMYFLYRIEDTKLGKIRMFVFLVVMILLGSVLVRITMYLSGNYYKYILGEEQGSYFRLIMKIYLLFVYLYTLRDKAWENGINKIMLCCMFMAILVCSWGLNIFMFFRMRMYFSVSEFIGIPIILKYNNRGNSSKRFLVNMMLVIYIVLLVISYNTILSNNSLSYDFFWNK